MIERVYCTRLRAQAVVSAVLSVALTAAASGQVTLLTQQRTLTVAASANGAASSVTSMATGPFVRQLQTRATVITGAGSVPILGAGRIDCQLSPNALTAQGLLSGSGAAAGVAGDPELGESNVDLRATFRVTEPTPYSLLVAARPALRSTDEFKVRLRDLTHHDDLADIDQTDPPVEIDLHGTLQPGEYEVRFKVEGTFDASEVTAAFAFDLALAAVVPSDCNGNGSDDRRDIVLHGGEDANHDGMLDGCQCLANWSGGALATQDVFDFVGDWFQSSADFNHDGESTTADISDYLNAWFAGC